MYAVIETGGKQYRVEVGTELEVELLDAEPGKTITVGRVLLVADGDDASIGRPVVDGAAVSAEVVRQGRGEKLISFKYGPKTRRRVKKGHRQELTVLRISDITLNGKSAAKIGCEGRIRCQDRARSDSRRPLPRRRPRMPSSPRSSRPRAKESTGARPRPKKSETKAETKRTRRPRRHRRRRPKAESQGRREGHPPPKKTTTRAKASGAKAADEAGTATDKPAPKKRAAKPRATKKDE